MDGLLDVCSGSVIGGWARCGLSVWLNPRDGHCLIDNLTATAIGGFPIGHADAYFNQNRDFSLEWWLLAITGLLGSLTNFSSFSAEVVTLIARGEPMWALVVASSHLATSLLLTAVGFWIYR